MGVFQSRGGQFGLCLLVAMVVLSATTGPATADSHVGIERSGDTVDVTVSASDFNDTSQSSVLVDGTQIVTYSPTFDGETNTTRLPIERFANVSGSLGDANVTVRAGDETVASNRMDLRYVSTAGETRVADGNSTIVLPVDNESTVGITAGDTVPVTVSDERGANETVDGSYGNGSIRIHPDQFEGQINLFGKLTFRPLSPLTAVSYSGSISDGTTATLDLSEAVTTFRHPLLRPDQDYDIVVDTTNPSGTYSARVNTTDGAIHLPESIFYADAVSAQIRPAAVDADYTPINVSRTRGDSVRARGMLDRTNQTLIVDTDVPASIVAVWVRDNGTVWTVQPDRLNTTASRLNLSDTGVDLGSDATAVLVGNETIWIDITAATTTPTNNSSAVSGNASSASGVVQTATSNILFVLTLLLTPLTGALVYVTTRDKNNLNSDALTVSVTGLLVGIGGGAWYTDRDPVAFASFLGLALIVAIVLFVVWLALAEREEFDDLSAVGGAVLVTTLLIGVLGAVNTWVLSAPSDYLDLVGAGYGLLAAGALTVTLSYGNAARSRQSGPPTYDATIRVVDETGSPIGDQTTVRLTRGNGLDSDRNVTVTGGSANVSLRPGDWTLKGTLGGQSTSTRSTVQRAGQQLTLQFSGRSVSLDIVDEESHSGLADATIIATVNGDEQRHSPDRTGHWQATYPLSAESISVRVRHDRYEDVSFSRPLDSNIDGTVEMTPKKGTVVATVEHDGDGVADVPVELTLRDGGRSNGFHETTDENGTVSFESIRIGTYEVTPSLTDRPSAFDTDSATVTVSENRTTREELPIGFEYELSIDHRDRIRELRDRVDDIATVTRRDGAIPAFYASVLHELLDTVEDIPNRGHPLLASGIEPDTVADTMLAAIDTAVETVDDVMSSKRNVDLFSACSDLQSVSVTWNGSVSMTELLDLGQRDIGQQRGELADHIERVDDRISAEIRNVAEVSPAREMLEAVRTMVRDNANVSQVESAALIVTAEAILEAIEALFDNHKLRERMERTVY